MKIREIRTDAEFRELQPAWESLLGHSASNTIFLTWQWVSAWVSAYGKPGDLRILTAWDDAGRLCGIAPLRSEITRKYGQTVEQLFFIGDGSNDSEYLDCIIASGYEQPVMEAFHQHWAEDLRSGRAFILREVPVESVNFPWYRKLAEPQGHLFKEATFPCGTVRLSPTWDEYLAKLRPRFRTKVRSVLRNLEERPEVRFGFCQTEQDLDRLLPVLFELHKRRWVQDGMPGVFGWDRKRDFYRKLSPLLLERGWLRFSWLEWKGQVLACQYGFAYGGTYFHLQEGYEPASEHRSVGIGVRAWSIREFLKEGIQEYDFLGGIGRHKTDWGAEPKYSAHLQIARETLPNKILFSGPEWEEQLKETLKKVIPEKVLAARTRRIEQRRQLQANHNSPMADSLRQGVAKCYFHLRLPTLARPLRDKYQLSPSPRSRWGRYSLAPRQQPSARILYYHRVNDEGDPFFPATSTHLFDQEMRYIADHYKVVSLGALLKHLEDGSRESLLAITFDDGYQDNYQNAFPILQKYGLPATIFLTTGSLDSREPLWFERLAHALKTTACEYVDLEIDIPRRFRTTTEAERLESNGAIFALLRGLSNQERQFWLEAILQQLNPPPTDRNDKMLTWDQVRFMKAHNIDFGGHTVTHPFISKLTRDEAVWELSECKRRIEQEVQQPAEFFAYPNGREEDFGDWNKEILRTSGYRAAMTTIWGLNYQSTDRMELRRGGPWETNPALFAYKLDWYQLVNE